MIDFNPDWKIETKIITIIDSNSRNASLRGGDILFILNLYERKLKSKITSKEQCETALLFLSNSKILKKYRPPKKDSKEKSGDDVYELVYFSRT